MFVKPFSKYNKTTKQRYIIYSLCESYRIDGHVRHRSIICFGKLEELDTEEQIKQLGKRVEEMIKHGSDTLGFNTVDGKVEELAAHFYTEIKRKKRYDISDREHEWEMVDMSSLKNNDARELGGEWLCKQAFDQLKIGDFLRGDGWSEENISLACTHIVSRAVYPASELKTASYVKENSAICELTGFDREKVSKDRLYAISHKLYAVKDQLEQYLSRQTNELFDLEDKIILYDLTNTYFEGQMKGSKLAKFGRSKEKRRDARLIVLAVVINREGFLKYSNIFEGNMSDSKTLKIVIKALSKQTSFTDRKPTVVMDAGIATDDNVEMLKHEGYDYMCVSRSNLKDYRADTDSNPVMIKDKKNQPIELLKVRCRDNDDNYLWVKSHAKALKENSMNGLLSQRFEEGIQTINAALNKKGGTKKLDRVHQRIGRLKQKYPSVHKYYNIIVSDDKNGVATQVRCEHKKGQDPGKKAGIYFLRTSLNGEDEKTLWLIYNIIREVESTFRVLKSDLDLRPIYHKTDDASMAHLHLGLLAYWLVSTIRYQLKQKGYCSDWREIRRIMNTQKCVTTNITNINDQVLSVRKCTEPTSKTKEIYDLMGYKHVPFYRKKSVVLPVEIFENDST
ncbi:IS1634 family transposase [bacterium]|nr:IS1634 family transposase [bacterium]